MANDDKLKVLGQTAADVPVAATKLVDEVAAAITSLNEAFPADLFLTSDLDERLKSVETRVRNYITENEKEYDELQEEVKSVVSVLEEMSEAMNEGSQGLFNEYDKFVSEVNELGTFLSQETERVTTSLEGLERVRGEMDQVVDVRMPALTAAYQELLEKYPEVEEAVKSLDSECGEQIENLQNRVIGQQDDLEMDLANLTELLGGVAESLLEEIGSDFEKAEKTLAALDGDAKEKIQGQLVQDITAKLKTAQSIIEDTEAKLREMSGETSEVRELAGPALARIEAVSEVLEGLIDKVKEVAQTFSSSLGF